MSFKKVLYICISAILVIFFACLFYSSFDNSNDIIDDNAEIEENVEIEHTVLIDLIIGNGSVIHENGTKIIAYEGMHLTNGDKVEIGDNSNFLLKFDSDIDLLVGPNTVLTIDTEDDDEVFQRRIILDSGSVLSEIIGTFNEDEFFEVITPSSKISTSKSIFKSTAIVTEGDIKYNLIEVFEGQVLESSNSFSEDIAFEAGKSVLIKKGNDDLSCGFIPADDIPFDISKIDDNLNCTSILDDAYFEINYNELSPLELKKLRLIDEKNRPISISDEEINLILDSISK